MFIQKNAPRWAILIIDLIICQLSILLSFLLRFDFDFNHRGFNYFLPISSIILVVRFCSFIIGRSYQGIIRYTESKDIQRIFFILLSGSVIVFLGHYLVSKVELNLKISRAVVMIDFMVSFFLMVIFRLSVKETYQQLKKGTKIQYDVLIYGADGLSLMAKKALERDAGTKYKVIAFVDHGSSRSGKKLDGVSVIKETEMEQIFKLHTIHHVIISSGNITKAKKQALVDLTLKYDSRVLDVPPVESWVKGELSFKQIKRVKIEDLLGREPIVLNNQVLRYQVYNKVVLVTGGAGSIGGELVRQLATYEPKKLIVVDQAESPMYELELELNERFPNLKLSFVIGDVTNKERMMQIFQYDYPELVYHAAAYKHVPLMEGNPTEAVRVNVIGTKIVAELCHQLGVEKMVFVSTDKAVNPTNVMGASKRIAEMFVQSLNTYSNCDYVTTRFGNVLGSNGSVIPLFRKQIESGGPITVTHPDVSRFFMTIPEACQLILEAGCMGKGGEIYVFDMGESIKIVDLAKKMIKLSRLELGKDIEIVFTGLRPGEKLYEELLNNKENTLQTHHPKILIGKVRKYNLEDLNVALNVLFDHLQHGEQKMMVKQMKQIVPEYKSNNSVYEVLD